MEHERLADAISNTQIAPTCESVAEILKQRDLLEAKLAPAIAELDAMGEWELEGATSMVDWVRNNGRMSGGQAKAMCEVACKVVQLPATAQAWAKGELSSTQVRIITANVKQRRIGLFAEHEGELIPTFAGMTAAETLHAMEQWRVHAEAIDNDIEPADWDRALAVSETMHGRREITGNVDAIGGHVLEKALDMATTKDADTELRTAKQRRADALIDICRFFLDNHTAKGSDDARRHRPHLDVVMDVDDTVAGRFIDGAVAPRAFIESLLCDCNLHRVLANGRSGILDYGRSARTAPADLFNAIALRDGHCREPGCDRPPSWCDAHHVQMWEDDGHTKLANMVLRCSRHHHSWHKRRNLGWTERLESDGTLVLTDASGRIYSSRPAGPVVQHQLVSV